MSVVALAATVEAAEITDVKDAFDGPKKWNAALEITYQRTQKRARITREYGCNPANGNDKQRCTTPSIIDLSDLTFSHVENTMLFQGRFGLYHDFELYFALPYVVSSERSGGFASGVTGACAQNAGAYSVDQTQTNSEIVKNGVFTGGQSRPPGDKDPYSVYGVDSLGNQLGGQPCLGGSMGIPYSFTRKGLGDLRLGLAWAPINQDRDDVKSTWVLGLEIVFPTGDVMDPTPQNVSAGVFTPRNSGVGKGLWALRWYTTFAHRVHSNVEPYAGLDLTLGLAGTRDSFFKSIAKTQDYAAPGPVAGAMAGVEFYPWWNVKKERKLSIDLRLRTAYTGEGRGYSEVADFIGRVTSIEQYITIGGMLAVYFQPVRNFQLRIVAGLEYSFDHFLTFADQGKDLNNSGKVDSDKGERNPSYDDNTDRPGKRLRIGDTTIFSLMFTLMGQF